jgi:microcystin-dependent protein
MFGFNFAPTGWAQCNGQLLPISQNTALFSLLGTMYGGDGKSTFALPDLQDSVPIEWGQAAGGSLYDQGQIGGAQFITLLVSEMPFHTHVLSGNFNIGDVNDPSPARCLARAGTGNLYQSNTSANLVQMAPEALPPAGASLPHNNMMAYLVVNFCIAMQGVFPPRG